jgi:hypothetical protein
MKICDNLSSGYLPLHTFQSSTFFWRFQRGYEGKTIYLSISTFFYTGFLYQSVLNGDKDCIGHGKKGQNQSRTGG